VQLARGRPGRGAGDPLTPVPDRVVGSDGDVELHAGERFSVPDTFFGRSGVGDGELLVGREISERGAPFNYLLSLECGIFSG
jgi:hypothetical protein